jgi:pyruvate/2-oxoacid:ferredoxin oxidoreductase alpha subunit
MMEGISYLAGAELPAVIVSIMRAGPGLGNINPEQADYFQATKGGGHGSYRLIVLAIKTDVTGEYRFMPEANDTIRPGDVLVVLGREIDLARFSALD